MARLSYRSTREADLSILDQLARKSMVLAEAHNGETRFRLLEPIRQYAHEKLDAMGERGDCQQRHARTYLQLAEAVEPHLRDKEQRQWLDRLEREHDNFRAALAWSLSGKGDIELGLRLAASLWRFWQKKGYLSEGRRWLKQTLEHAEAESSSTVRARALLGLGALLFHEDFDLSRIRLEEALVLFRNLGDQEGAALSLREIGRPLIRRGDRAGVSYVEQSLSMFRHIGLKWAIPDALSLLAWDAFERIDDARTTALYEESLAIAREMGDQSGVASALSQLCDVMRSMLQFERSKVLGEESLRIARETGDRLNEIAALWQLAEAV